MSYVNKKYCNDEYFGKNEDINTLEPRLTATSII